MNMRKTMALLLAAFLGAATFSGCSNATGGGGNGTATPTADPTQAAQKDPVTIRFMWWGDDARHEATLKSMEAYRAANPHVTFNGEYGGFDGYREKLVTQLAGGTAADIIQLDTAWNSDLMILGDFFLDFNTVRDKIDLSNFDEQIMVDYGYEGQIIGLPTGISARTLLYNKTVAEMAGITLPEKLVWEDLSDMAAKLRAVNSDYYLLNLDTDGIKKMVIMPYLTQLNGNNLITDDYKLGFTEDELKQALTLVRTLYENGVLQPAQESAAFNNTPQTNPKWINHEFFGTIALTTVINDKYYDFQDTAGVILPPVMADAKDSGMPVKPGQIISVNAGSSNVDESLSFLDYFFNSEESAKLLGTTRGLPTNKLARQICLDEGKVSPVITEAISKAESLPGIPVNALSNGSVIQAILDDVCERLMYSNESIDAIAAECVKLMQGVLDDLKDAK